MVKIHGHELLSGDTELTVRLRGKSRRYTYQGTTQNSQGRTVIHLVGPINGDHPAFHACYPEDVQTVHQTSASAR